ncbi:MAG: FtsW/RodA/SpoVE family cell cycle protein [Synergistales bacterium]
MGILRNGPDSHSRVVREDGGADPLLWLIPLLLSGVGVIMVSSSSSPISMARFGSPQALGVKQAVWLLIGMGSMLVAYSIPIETWRKRSGLFWLAAVGFCFLPLLPVTGVSAGGARRWVNLGLVTVQSADILFFAFTLHAGRKLYESRERENPAGVFMKICILAAISVIPLLLQPDMGSTILVFILAMGLYVPLYGWAFPLVCGGGLLALGFPYIFTHGYRLRRLKAFIDPWEEPLGSGFQAIQGLVAFSNGGIWGMGLGQGLQKLKYLPASHTDFILAAIGEELGLAGTLSVLALFGFWFYRLFFHFRRLEGTFEACLIWGLCLNVFFQLAINVGGVTKLIPLTGMPLPFLSYGGSSLVMMWVRVGLLLRLSRCRRPA